MEEKYYYLRDREGKLVITVCLLKDNGVVARGMALCSELDEFDTEIGKTIARGRAYQVLNPKDWARKNRIAREDGYSRPIMRQEAINLVWRVGDEAVKDANFMDFRYKAVKNPVLTPLEQKLIC